VEQHLVFVKESLLHAPVRAVFAFHERPDALPLLIPPWDHTRVVRPPASLAVGTVVELEMRIGPVPVRVEAVHTAYERDRFFEDTMRQGPFPHWRHRHVFEASGDGCLLRDEVEYEPPFGLLGRVLDRWLVRPRLEKMFAYRHQVTRAAVEGATLAG
jgi:ligand-binding SRPBCC domain-containing protein